MITLDNVQQGSEAWHRHRNSCWNASDIPAIMGVSPYKSRSKFMHEIATGISQEYDEMTMVRFSEGHRSESMARPLMAKIIGQSVFPVVGYTEEYELTRPLSASFDALVMDESVGGEHKSLNDEIRRVFANGDTLHELYTVQMEVQCMVSGAGRILFMASKWNGEELEEELHCWYEPNTELRGRILQSIRQFEKDLENYQHIERAEKPKAEAILNLPALAVQATGMVTYSNLPEFKAAAESYISNINTDLQTDQQFADAEATVKFCKSTEETLEVTKKAILAQTATIDEVIRTIDHIQTQLRDKRLMLDKLVKSEKETRKIALVSSVSGQFADHVAALQAEFDGIRLLMLIVSPDFGAAIKGLKSLASMHDALDTALANAKIEADAIAKGVRVKLTWCKEHAAGMSFLFPDLQQIISKQMDDFTLTITSRIKEHREAEERKEAEMRAKAEADAAAKLEAERAIMRTQEEAKAQAAAQKTIDEAAAKVKVEQDAAAAKIVTVQPAQAVQAPTGGHVVIIEHQDAIGAFLASRDFGKEAGKVRAILVEFVKFDAQFRIQKTA